MALETKKAEMESSCVCPVVTGLNAAGKTTVLYQLKRGDRTKQLPTVGESILVSLCLATTSFTASLNTVQQSPLLAISVVEIKMDE